MTPYEFCEAYIASTRNGEPFGWMLEDIHKLTLSHQRMYALIKKIETTRQNYLDNGSMIEQSELDKLDEEILAIIAEMEPKK